MPVQRAYTRPRRTYYLGKLRVNSVGKVYIIYMSDARARHIYKHMNRSLLMMVQTVRAKHINAMVKLMWCVYATYDKWMGANLYNRHILYSKYMLKYVR